MKFSALNKLGLVPRILLVTLLLGTVNLVVGLYMLPKINQELYIAFLLAGSFLTSFLIISYIFYILAGVFFGLSVQKSIKSLSASVNNVVLNNLDGKIEIKSFREIEELAKNLEKMRSSVKERVISAEEAKDRAEAILFNVGEGVFAVNLRGEIIIFNQVAEKMIGFSKDQILGQRYDQILQFYSNKTKQDYGKFIDQVLLEGKSISLPTETVLITANRAEIPVAVNSSPIRNQKGIIIGGIVVFRDISHEKEIEEIRTDLISIASHQLRTPLSEIKGLISLLSDGIAGPLNDKQKDYLNLLTIANDRMINLVNDLLNISRIEQGRLQLNFQSVNLGQIAKEVFQSLEIKANEKRQTLSLTIDPNVSLVTADPDKTKEIVSNLVENALKYTFEGGTINVRVTANTNNVWVLVQDNGVGIPKNKQKDLFQKFSRVENPLSKMTSGTGLGLYAAKQLVEKQNGIIWFESEEGKGSTFGFALPAIATVNK